MNIRLTRLKTLIAVLADRLLELDAADRLEILTYLQEYGSDGDYGA